MPDVPHAFANVIRLAWERGWDVRTGHPYTDDQRNVTISGDAGVVTLTWRSSAPFGVHAVSFRPKGTSVTSRVETVNEAIRQMEA